MKKIGIIIISAGLLLSILAGLCAQHLLHTPLSNDSADNSYLDFPESITTIEYAGIGEPVKSFGFSYESFATQKAASPGVSLTDSALYGLQSYQIAGHTVSYETCGGSDVVLNVYFDGVQIYSGAYLNGDTSLDLVFSGENEIDYMYNAHNEYIGAVINEGVLTVQRDQQNRILSLSLNGNQDRAYVYQNNSLTGEVINAQQLSYTYSTNGDLLCPDNHLTSARKEGSDVHIVYNGDQYTYEFKYQFNQQHYVTAIYKNGQQIASFSYLNNKLVAKKTAKSQLIYVLDNKGDYVGFVENGEFYLFAFDANGTVYAILDSEGKPTGFVEATAYGSYTLLQSTLPGVNENCIVYQNAVVDTDTGILCVADGLLVPADYKKVALDGTVSSMCAQDAFLNSSVAMTVPSLPAMQLFKDMVIDNLLSAFQAFGLSAAPYVEIADQYNNVLMTADIYTLDYTESPEQLQNLLNGNQAYKIVYNSADNLQQQITTNYRKIFRMMDFCHADYYTTCAVKPGSMTFGGQFIYLGYLVTYNSDGNGIIDFSLSENVPENYLIWNNIYNYDTQTYANYAQVTFSPSLWDYTTIIPGMNREQYEVLESAFQEVMDLEAHVFQETLEYYDQSYTNVTELNQAGDTLRLFENISEEEMLVLANDGSIRVEYLPLKDSPSLAKLIGTYVAVAAVGIIAVSVPGCQFLIPIVACAMRGSAAATMVSLLHTAIVTVIEADWTEWDGKDWEHAGRGLLSNAADSAVKGAIAGTISGIVQVGGNKIISKLKTKALTRLDKHYPYYVRNDCLQAATNYEWYRYRIESFKVLGLTGYPDFYISSQKSSILGKVLRKSFTKSAFFFYKENR